MIKIKQGDVIEELKKMPDNYYHAAFSDPPYNLTFMNKDWDNFSSPKKFQLWCEEWATELLRVMRPGAYGLIFGGTRTHHRLMAGLEDAGFEIKDCLMWLYGCLSEDTDILTTEGWKNYKDINNDHMVFSIDLDTQEIEQSKVEFVHKYDYDGEMISLKNDNTDQLLTPNHKVICKEKDRKQIDKVRYDIPYDKYRYKDAFKIRSKGHKLPLAGYYDGKYSIGGDFAEVIGWVLAEGHYQKDTNAVNIYQSSVNPKNVGRIRYCLGRAGIKYSEYQRNRTYKGREYTEYQWYIGKEYATKIKEIIPNKKPTKKLWHLKLSEKERLFNGLCGGDGSKGRSDKYQAFYQKDKDFLEWFQVLLHLSGKQGRINWKKESCSIHYNDSTEIQGKHHSKEDRIVDYKGIVWCIKTQKGNFIARRNGKIFITGNSGFPKSTNIAKNMDSNLGKKWVGMGTGLKPAIEFCILIQKPRVGTYANNCEVHGCGGLNIDKCRIKTEDQLGRYQRPAYTNFKLSKRKEEWTNVDSPGRWPANLILSDDSEILDKFPNSKSSVFPPFSQQIKEDVQILAHNDHYGGGYADSGSASRFFYQSVPDMIDEQSGISKSGKRQKSDKPIYGGNALNSSKTKDISERGHNDAGGASRFFYTAKASKAERNAGCEELEEKKCKNHKKSEEAYCAKCDARRFFNMKGVEKTHCDKCGTELTSRESVIIDRNNHPTLKPLSLCKYLSTLICPPGNKTKIIIPFSGSGSEMIGALAAGFHEVVGIEKEKDYVVIAKKRIAYWKEHLDEIGKKKKAKVSRKVAKKKVAPGPKKTESRDLFAEEKEKQKRKRGPGRPKKEEK